MTKVTTKPGLLSVVAYRPVATAMFFLALSLLGLFSWYKIPVELVPTLSGESLFVRFFRPGSAPQVIEREILIPLQNSIAQLAEVHETSAEIVGNTGSIKVEFESGSNIRIRELELRRAAAALAKAQPKGTRIEVATQDSSALSRFVMSVQVIGMDDSNTLRDLVDQQIKPVLASLSGVSQVFVSGGATTEATVSINTARCAELGIRMSQIADALQRSVQGMIYLGTVDQDQLRFAVMQDARATDLQALGEIHIDSKSPVLLRHVADIAIGNARKESEFRVNGQPSVALFVFQDKGANLIDIGQRVGTKITQLQAQFEPYKIELITSYDASKTVNKQLKQLRQLALSGFAVALLVLFLFLREFRAVLVVAIAVPVSLLIAGAMLYLNGYTLNLITLFGLVIGVGMLVDNSIVVYETVQSSMEKGVEAKLATINGVKRTLRAILTASLTNAVVFIPVLFIDEIPIMVRHVLENIVPAILYPLAASLLVAIGLVPMLARYLAAPATRARMRLKAQRRATFEGETPVQLPKEMFAALLKVALRRPLPWLVGIFASILLTVIIALPWVLVQSISQPSAQAEQVRMEVEINGGGSLQSAGLVFERLERAALGLKGVASVESNFQEEQGSITIHLKDQELLPKDVDAAKVRRTVTAAVNDMDNVQLKLLGPSNSDDSDGLSGNSSEISISGPDMTQLNLLAENVKSRLLSITQIGGASVSTVKGMDEIQVTTNDIALAGHVLAPQQVLDVLSLLGREGQQMPFGFNQPDGREIPLKLRREMDKNVPLVDSIGNLPIMTNEGVIALRELIQLAKKEAPTAIVHHNGRRELTVEYRLAENAAKTGPQRLALEQQIEAVVRDIYRPKGYTIEVIGAKDSTDWFKLIVIPILLLLYAVLAMTFESFTLPLLVLVAVPLTILGAVWALFIAGFGIDMMAIIGVVVLLGLTVNPAIILVDRMQQRVRNTGCGGGSAAINALRQRTRPVLMTACTSIAGLWPLALASGQELEAWPPFAVVVMGGLITSTILTLLVIPIGFATLSRIDKAIASLNVWALLSWLGLTCGIMFGLVITDVVQSFIWQFCCALIIGGALLWLIIGLLYRKPTVSVDGENMVIETRYLQKVYGQMGPIGKAWHKYQDFNRRLGHRIAGDNLDRLTASFLLLAGTLYLTINVQSLFWQLAFAYISAIMLYQLINNIRYWINCRRQQGLVEQIPPSRWIKLTVIILPWLVLGAMVFNKILWPKLNQQPTEMLPALAILLAILTFLLQRGRSAAVKYHLGIAVNSPARGRFQRLMQWWRKLCGDWLAFDLQPQEFTALSCAHIRMETGMIGILGPNGAGKTTLLRLLATILSATSGTIHFAGIEKRKLGRQVSRLIGYLPQEFGLPQHLSAKEYLTYYALLYRIGPEAERQKRINQLLLDVGLDEQKDRMISSYSGGMRQRVAVARTLLGDPPVIIVDEPTVGLDPRERIRFRNLLEKLSLDRIVLFSTHVVEDVAVSCERVLVQRAGVLVYDGNPDDLANIGNGNIWQLLLGQDEAKIFEKQHKVIDQVPQNDNMLRLRVLSPTQPHPQAQLVESSLEDGYMQLLYGENS